MAGEQQAGAAIGTAVGSFWGPAGAAVGGALGGAVGGLATAPAQGGGAGGGPMFTTAQSSTYGTMLGNDNWTVNFGGSNTNIPTATKTITATEDDRQMLGQVPPALGSDLSLGSPLVAGFGGGDSWLLLGLGALVLFKVMKGRRHG